MKKINILLIIIYIIGFSSCIDDIEIETQEGPQLIGINGYNFIANAVLIAFDTLIPINPALKWIALKSKSCNVNLNIHIDCIENMIGANGVLHRLIRYNIGSINNIGNVN